MEKIRIYSKSKQNRCMYFSCTFTLKSAFNLGRHELRCRQKKSYCLDIGEKRDETMKSKSNRRLSGLVGGT